MKLNAWKSAATDWDLERGTVVAIREGVVKSYTKDNFTEISVSLTNVPWANPSDEETEELKAWMAHELAK